jgi:hypothetical protein
MRHRHSITVVIVIIVATACQIEPTAYPQRCPVEDLLLDKSLFHEDFHRWSPSKDAAPMRFGIRKVGVGFSSETKGGAIQAVYRGPSVKETQRQFTNFAGSEFSSREGWTEWYIPDSFDYQSSVADQYRFSCYRHIASGVETCQAIGQYGPYLIRFHADMSSILTYQDLDRMLQAIDEKAAWCLGK